MWVSAIEYLQRLQRAFDWILAVPQNFSMDFYPTFLQFHHECIEGTDTVPTSHLYSDTVLSGFHVLMQKPVGRKNMTANTNLWKPVSPCIPYASSAFGSKVLIVCIYCEFSSTANLKSVWITTGNIVVTLITLWHYNTISPWMGTFHHHPITKRGKKCSFKKRASHCDNQLTAMTIFYLAPRLCSPLQSNMTCCADS